MQCHRILSPPAGRAAAVQRACGRALLAVFALTGLLAAPAAAIDGVIEISQAEIEATGGFPFVIDEPGSYRLTSNLVVASSADAIRVDVAGATIDLNGFEISGPVSCSATLDGAFLASVDCSGSGGSGIEGASAVLNGSIRGFGTGIQGVLDRPVRVQQVHLTQNSSSGFSSRGADFQFLDSSATLNRFYGIYHLFNTGHGIVRNSTVSQNGTYGLYLGGGLVSHSTFRQNGQALRSNNSRACLATDNFFESNATGFYGTFTCGYRSNVFFNHSTENVGGSPENLGGNLCDGVLCP